MSFPPHAIRLLSAVAVAIVSLAGCFQMPTAATMASLPGQGPTHPPTTPEQWTVLEVHAKNAAESSGMTALSEPHRLVATGFHLQHDIKLEERTCYEAGLAWAFAGTAHVSINYQPGADGAMPNDQLGATGGTLEQGAGNVRFCADHAGLAILTVSSVGSSGAITNNELLEYALVLGSQQESAAETETRRADEAARGSASGARIEANIAAAKERERQNRARVCQDCGDKLILCRTRRAAGQRQSGASCESDYRFCTQGVGGCEGDASR